MRSRTDCFQGLPQFVARLIALHGIFGDGLLDDGIDRRRQGRLDGSRRDRVVIHHLVDDGGRTLPGEGLLAGEHLVEHGAEREDVRAMVDAAAGGLLGGKVARGAQHHARLGKAGITQLGDAEIHHLDGAAVGDHQVGGLQVAVDDACLVGKGHGRADLIGVGE